MTQKPGRAGWVAMILIIVYGSGASAQPHLVDQFGRSLDSYGITLVDWDGQVANPLIRVSVSPPAGAVFPATLTLSANGARLYFDSPSNVSGSGPSKTLFFSDASSQDFSLSIFPDRDGLDEAYELTIACVDAANVHTQLTVPIHVSDQDLPGAGPFAVNITFSQDLSGFFSDPAKRAIVAQAANDWAYFFDDLNLDPVAAGNESTYIWSYPLAFSEPPPNGDFVTNISGYTGFLSYFYGIDTPLQRSGGEPSLCCYQSSDGNGLPLRRSGGVEIDIKGNFNTLGWFLTTGDDDWWVTGNFGDEANDLYSIAHHEFGHSLAFNSGYDNFASGEDNGFDDSAVTDYQGETVYADPSVDHFTGYVDRQSGVGAFGYEYFGSVPRRRWSITKLDLLLMQEVGYPLRMTSAFVPLAIATASLPDGQTGVAYSAVLSGAGGVPFYDWTIDAGTLPAGLALNRFTGAITGMPTTAGTYFFTARLREYDVGPGETADLSIAISQGCLPGDVDDNGRINGADIAGYVRVKLTGTGTAQQLCAANLTVQQFVGLLLGQ